jgi:hypothetical protein
MWCTTTSCAITSCTTGTTTTGIIDTFPHVTTTTGAVGEVSEIGRFRTTRPMINSDHECPGHGVTQTVN